MAAKKQGVGIWEHYRTTDRADGFEYRGHIDGHRVHAKLYWAPADWRNPDKCGKRPYVVVMFDGEMNQYGSYENELRNYSYVGEERPRRNWNELCAIAEGLDEWELKGYVDDALLAHQAYLYAGFTFENGFYTLPTDKTAEEAYAMANEFYNSRKVA